jgi:hypothetical protein
MGCTPTQVVRTKDRAFVLCPSSLVVVVSLTPTPHIEQRRPMRHHVAGLAAEGDAVFVRFEGDVTSWPIDDAAAPPETQPELDRVLPMFQAPEQTTAPPEHPRVGRFEMTLAGTGEIGVGGTKGAGGVFDASVVYRTSAPFMVGAFGTFGAGTGSFDAGSVFTGPKGGDLQVAVGEVVVGVDSRYVEFDVGPGAALYASGYDVVPLFAMRGRFGRRDRFDFTWHASFAINAPSQFCVTCQSVQLGVMGAALQFRLSPGWWLTLDGAFGNLRYGRMMLDLRHRIRGSGSHDTLELQGGLGLAMVESSASCDNNLSVPNATTTTCHGSNAQYIGPAATFGVLWRL